jgi:sortase A
MTPHARVWFPRIAVAVDATGDEGRCVTLGSVEGGTAAAPVSSIIAWRRSIAALSRREEIGSSMSLVSPGESGRSVRVPGTPMRVDPLAGVLVLAGLLLLGTAVAVLSKRAADDDLQRDRIIAMQPTATVAAPAIQPTREQMATADVTPSRTTSNDVPLVEAIETPTARPATPRAGTQQPTPAGTPTPVPDMPPPTHIKAPAVGIDTTIVEVSSAVEQMEGESVYRWQVADWAAGHHDTSASPGEGGNVVLAGHDDYKGEVFRGLHDIKIGDDVFVTSPSGTFHYVVAEVHLRKERGVSLAERLGTGTFMNPMPVERLTLITCWPYGIDDHRLIVVANPAEDFRSG